jgi:hypothetical protein
MVVAILFCLINNEVMQQLKKFCGDHLNEARNPQSMAMTQYTVRNNNQLPLPEAGQRGANAVESVKFAQ